MKTVTVAQALKQRKRLEQRLQQYQSLVKEQNCLIEGSRRVVDVREMMGKCEELEARILTLRKAVAQANQAVSDKLVELDMLKKRQRFISNIPVDETVVDRVGTNLVRKEAVVRASEILDLNETLQDRINALQDELDGFNATARVQIEG